LSLQILDQGPIFVADTHVNNEPTPEQLAETMVAAARHVQRFGLTPKIALCSGSQFGNLDSRSGQVARAALAILEAEQVDFEYEGEMNTDAALNPDLRERQMPGNRLNGKANVLVYTNSDAAGAARNLLKMVADGLEVGPILMGMGNRAHIVTPGVTVRGLLNIAALAGTPVSSYG
jgi:malate dehydrogenase (oxaloacetate-decarboxylating)(NADP+)